MIGPHMENMAPFLSVKELNVSNFKTI